MKRNRLVSQETREQTMLSNPTRLQVKTPDGIFPSLKAAARHYNVTGGSIAYYCKLGEAQRSGKPLNLRKKADYTQFEILTSNPDHTHKKAVRTPLGDFRTMADAAKAHNLSICAVSQKIKRSAAGWSLLKNGEQQ